MTDLAGLCPASVVGGSAERRVYAGPLHIMEAQGSGSARLLSWHYGALLSDEVHVGAPVLHTKSACHVKVALCDLASSSSPAFDQLYPTKKLNTVAHVTSRGIIMSVNDCMCTLKFILAMATLTTLHTDTSNHLED